MKTPICDFVEKYISDNKLRLHMPGHKGASFLGIEKNDITEVSGADSLFEADGIINESETNVSLIFGTKRTLFSTEGSSLSIRAMLFLAVKYAISKGCKPKIIAGRNAHKTFLSAAALLDFSLSFIPEKSHSSYLSCHIDYELLEKEMAENGATALYITSPDYLGNMADIERLSKLCRKYGMLLLVDNAHGAYLKFLTPSLHPIDLGADICCDSAHKTLPVLTGGAYLHISKNAPEYLSRNAKNAMALFASTSPSYIIMQSLDRANDYLSSGYSERLGAFIIKLTALKNGLKDKGFDIINGEPLKITIAAKKWGYTGEEFAEVLRCSGAECEFADRDFTVLMLTPENEDDLTRIFDIICSVVRKTPINEIPPKFELPERVMSVREAVFANSEKIPVEKASGRILSALNVGCPPAVPIALCGERLNDSCIRLFEYYGIEFCDVVAST